MNQTESTGVPSIVHDVLNSPGQPLDQATRAFFEPRFRRDFSQVRVHTDKKAAESARTINALAYTVGQKIVFAADQYHPQTVESRLLLGHELAHSVQQASAPKGTQLVMEKSLVLEGEADRTAESVMFGDPPSKVTGVSVQVAMPSMAEKIILRGAKWLSKRTATMVSKHIAKHARRIAEKAIHSVFKSPKDIKFLLGRALKEAMELAARHPKAPVTQILEEGGVKIAQQGTHTPGKFRWVVQKVFDKEIGTKGEKILRIFIDETGRIVSAFPADRLIAIGLGVGSIGILGERTAEANEFVRQQARIDAAREEKEQGLDWEDFIPFIGDIWGGSLNVGEDEMLREERFIREAIEDIIIEIEFNEKRTLGPKDRREIEDLVRASIAAPLLAEESKE
jgi:hypothetical protein